MREITGTHTDKKTKSHECKSPCREVNENKVPVREVKENKSPTREVKVNKSPTGEVNKALPLMRGN